MSAGGEDINHLNKGEGIPTTGESSCGLKNVEQSPVTSTIDDLEDPREVEAIIEKKLPSDKEKALDVDSESDFELKWDDDTDQGDDTDLDIPDQELEFELLTEKDIELITESLCKKHSDSLNKEFHSAFLSTEKDLDSLHKTDSNVTTIDKDLDNETDEAFEKMLTDEVENTHETNKSTGDTIQTESMAQPSTTSKELEESSDNVKLKDVGTHQAQPSTSHLELSDEDQEATDSLGLLAESSRVMDDDDEQEQEAEPDDDDDYDDFDQDDAPLVRAAEVRGRTCSVRLERLLVDAARRSCRVGGHTYTLRRTSETSDCTDIPFHSPLVRAAEVRGRTCSVRLERLLVDAARRSCRVGGHTYTLRRTSETSDCTDIPFHSPLVRAAEVRGRTCSVRLERLLVDAARRSCRVGGHTYTLRRTSETSDCTDIPFHSPLVRAAEVRGRTCSVRLERLLVDAARRTWRAAHIHAAAHDRDKRLYRHVERDLSLKTKAPLNKTHSHPLATFK